MARTRAEIKQAMIDYRDGSAVLSEFNSTSATSIIMLLIDMVSFAIFAVESLWDIFRQEVADMEASAYVHTAPWYAERMLEYQHGDALVIDPVTYQPSYAVLDVSKRVIAQVAVVGQGIAVVKCAKDLGGGVLGPLTSPEVTGATSYLRDIQSPSIQIGLVSLNADLLKIGGTVVYKGTLIDVQTAVETAIIDFLRTINNINFNGEQRRSDIIAAVRAVNRVEDFHLSLFEGKRDGGVYEAIGRSYLPFSGYSQIDTFDFPLSATITYIAV